EPSIATVTTWVGSGVPRFYLPLDQIFPQANVSQVILVPKSLPEREELRKRLPVVLAEEFPEARGRVKLLPNGPPVPYPVQFRVSGADPKVVREWADKAKDILRASPNMRGVNDNWNENVKTLRLNVDQDKARALGVTSQALAQASRTLLSGTVIGQYREADKLIDIVLRQPIDERAVITDFGNAYLPTTTGRAVPLTQVAKLEFGWEPGVMWREGRAYAVTVQGDVAEGLQGATVTKEVWPKLDELQKQMPVGYRIDIAGNAPTQTYTMTDQTLGSVVSSGSFTPGQAITVDGMSVTISGATVAGDAYAITGASNNLKLFDVIDKAIVDLSTGVRPPAQITQANTATLRDIDAVLGNLQTVRSATGERLNNLDGTEGRLAALKQYNTQEKSAAEDLDMVQGISDFQNQQTGYEAALKTYASVQRLSLFQYINV
ncbi:MAG: efflux RND transporter permease subunit, partial [Proteobacteria bacterium]|nr:efflux RND transporter permease subunit [Pseudomonadota bacterium]